MAVLQCGLGNRRTGRERVIERRNFAKGSYLYSSSPHQEGGSSLGIWTTRASAHARGQDLPLRRQHAATPTAPADRLGSTCTPIAVGLQPGLTGGTRSLNSLGTSACHEGAATERQVDPERRLTVALRCQCPSATPIYRAGWRWRHARRQSVLRGDRTSPAVPVSRLDHGPLRRWRGGR
jgi:hypothetical protein